MKPTSKLEQLKSFIKNNEITRSALILFLQKKGAKVYKKDTTDEIIKRLDENFLHSVLVKELPKLKARKKIVTKTPLNINDEIANSMVAILEKKSFQGAYQSYKIGPVKYKGKVLDDFFVNFISNAKVAIKKVLTEQLKKLHGLKVKLSYAGWFFSGFPKTKGDKANDLDEDDSGFWQRKSMNVSKPLIVLNDADIENAADQQCKELIKEIEDFVQYKSGWVWKKNIKININIFKYQPIKGSSYIELPAFIHYKKACVNIKNQDQKCFLWSVIRNTLDASPGNPNRRTKEDLEEAKKYDSWTKYPMEINDIPKFEKEFNKSINVYTYETKFSNKTHTKKVDIFPIYTTKNFFENYDNMINLLLINDGKNTHYVLIKHITRLLRQNYNDNQAFICPFCPKNYRSKEDLIEHMKKGCFDYQEAVELPSEEEAKEYVKFKSMRKMLKKPFVIYADFESILVNYRDQNKCKLRNINIMYLVVMHLNEYQQLMNMIKTLCFTDQIPVKELLNTL